MKRIFLVVIALFLMVAIGFAQNETVNWKTYRSDEYRFEFQYPSSWIVKHWEGERTFYVCNEKLAASCGPLPEGVIASFTITVIDNKDGLSLDQYIFSPAARGFKIVETATVGGQEALITVPAKSEAHQYLGEYLWIYNYEYILKMIAGFETKKDFYEEFGEILSTFKFIPVPIVDGGDCC